MNIVRLKRIECMMSYLPSILDDVYNGSRLLASPVHLLCPHSDAKSNQMIND